MPTIQQCKAQEMQIACIYKAQRRLLFYLYLQHRANNICTQKSKNVAVNGCMHTHTSKLSSPYKIHMNCEMQLWDYSPLAISEGIIEKRLIFALISTWVKTNRARQSPNECRAESILSRPWTHHLLLHSLAEHSWKHETRAVPAYSLKAVAVIQPASGSG